MVPERGFEPPRSCEQWFTRVEKPSIRDHRPTELGYFSKFLMRFLLFIFINVILFPINILSPYS